MSEDGQRLNIRKATLRDWRRGFARCLRAEGIAANATERAVRGESRTYKGDGIYRATLRGDSSHSRARLESVASELLKGVFIVEPSKARLIETRKQVERGWRATQDILLAQGHSELANQVCRFLDQMPPPMTDKEHLATQFLKTVQAPKAEFPDPDVAR